MSLVIAIKDKDRIVFGADKQVSGAGSKSHNTIKIWDVPELPGAIMGGVGSLRASQVIQYSKLIDLNAMADSSSGTIDTSYIITVLVPQIVLQLQSAGVCCIAEDDVEENACGGKKKNNEVEDSEDEACKKKCSTEDSEDNACKTKKCSEDDVEENACGKKNKCEVEDSDDNACGKKKNNEVEDSEDEACKTKKCSVETEEFALSLNNTFRAIRRCLDSYTYEYTSFWGDTYTCPKYYVEDLIPTESIAVVYDEEEGINYGIKYALDNDDVVLSMDDKRVYIQEWRAKEEGFSKFECDDKSKAKEEIFEAVGKELKELREFKADVEDKEAKAEFDAQVEGVLAKFNFEEEEVSDLVEKVYNKSIDLEMFETFLFALEAKKTRAEKEKFSAREKENSIGVVDFNEVKEEPKTKYSNILEKYGKKNK